MVPIILGKLPPEICRNLARAHTDPEWPITDLQEGSSECLSQWNYSNAHPNHQTVPCQLCQQPRSSQEPTSLNHGLSNQSRHAVPTVIQRTIPHLLATPSLTQEEEWKLFVRAICTLIVWVATELPSEIKGTV